MGDPTSNSSGSRNWDDLQYSSYTSFESNRTSVLQSASCKAPDAAASAPWVSDSAMSFEAEQIGLLESVRRPHDLASFLFAPSIEDSLTSPPFLPSISCLTTALQSSSLSCLQTASSYFTEQQHQQTGFSASSYDVTEEFSPGPRASPLSRFSGFYQSFFMHPFGGKASTSTTSTSYSVGSALPFSAVSEEPSVAYDHVTPASGLLSSSFLASAFAPPQCQLLLPAQQRQTTENEFDLFDLNDAPPGLPPPPHPTTTTHTFPSLLQNDLRPPLAPSSSLFATPPLLPPLVGKSDRSAAAAACRPAESLDGGETRSSPVGRCCLCSTSSPESTTTQKTLCVSRPPPPSFAPPSLNATTTSKTGNISEELATAAQPRKSRPSSSGSRLPYDSVFSAPSSSCFRLSSSCRELHRRGATSSTFSTSSLSSDFPHRVGTDNENGSGDNGYPSWPHGCSRIATPAGELCGPATASAAKEGKANARVVPGLWPDAESVKHKKSAGSAGGTSSKLASSAAAAAFATACATNKSATCNNPHNKRPTSGVLGWSELRGPDRAICKETLKPKKKPSSYTARRGSAVGYYVSDLGAALGSGESMLSRFCSDETPAASSNSFPETSVGALPSGGSLSSASRLEEDYDSCADFVGMTLLDAEKTRQSITLGASVVSQSAILSTDGDQEKSTPHSFLEPCSVVSAASNALFARKTAASPGGTVEDAEVSGGSASPQATAAMSTTTTSSSSITTSTTGSRSSSTTTTSPPPPQQLTRRHPRRGGVGAGRGRGSTRSSTSSNLSGCHSNVTGSAAFDDDSSQSGSQHSLSFHDAADDAPAAQPPAVVAVVPELASQNTASQKMIVPEASCVYSSFRRTSSATCTALRTSLSLVCSLLLLHWPVALLRLGALLRLVVLRMLIGLRCVLFFPTNLYRYATVIDADAVTATHARHQSQPQKFGATAASETTGSMSAPSGISAPSPMPSTDSAILPHPPPPPPYYRKQHTAGGRSKKKTSHQLPCIPREFSLANLMCCLCLPFYPSVFACTPRENSTTAESCSCRHKGGRVWRWLQQTLFLTHFPWVGGRGAGGGRKDRKVLEDVLTVSRMTHKKKHGSEARRILIPIVVCLLVLTDILGMWQFIGGALKRVGIVGEVYWHIISDITRGPGDVDSVTEFAEAPQDQLCGTGDVGDDVETHFLDDNQAVGFDDFSFPDHNPTHSSGDCDWFDYTQLDHEVQRFRDELKLILQDRKPGLLKEQLDSIEEVHRSVMADSGMTRLTATIAALRKQEEQEEVTEEFPEEQRRKSRGAVAELARLRRRLEKEFDKLSEEGKARFRHMMKTLVLQRVVRRKKEKRRNNQKALMCVEAATVLPMPSHASETHLNIDAVDAA